ncbi:MAG: Asp23/Gls24 family envelope stress response protein [Clostridiales bacterium]|nr:Asp23/Gls24 family envelope stress response protein [Clostridiales bacterium]
MAVKNNEANNGKITLDRKILVSIINLAAKEINGVESVSNTERPWYKKLFSRYDDGVEIKFEKNGALTIDVYLNLFVGFSVPDVAYRVQENIRNSLSTMVALKPLKINIHVLNVECDKEVQHA